MKKSVLLFFTLTMISAIALSQDIVEALALKEAKIGAYIEGEMQSNDTIIDLKHGYYEQSQISDGLKTILRQAALYLNDDNTKTLGIATSTWDFACMVYSIEFYEISNIDSITALDIEEVLPDLAISDLEKPEVLTIAHKYLPAYRKSYNQPDASVENLLQSEFYQVRYLLPREGSDIKAVLEFCHPVAFTDITDEDYEVLEQTSGSINLIYDRKHKRFIRP